MLLWRMLPSSCGLGNHAAAAVLHLDAGMVQRARNPPDADAAGQCPQGQECFGACWSELVAVNAAPGVWAWRAEGRLGCPADSSGAV